MPLDSTNRSSNRNHISVFFHDYLQLCLKILSRLLRKSHSTPYEQPPLIQLNSALYMKEKMSRFTSLATKNRNEKRQRTRRLLYKSHKFIFYSFYRTERHKDSFSCVLRKNIFPRSLSRNRLIDAYTIYTNRFCIRTCSKILSNSYRWSDPSAIFH